MNEIRMFYRVVSDSYASVNYNKIEDAIQKANEMNTIRVDTTNSTDLNTFVWYGANARIEKVTEIVESVSIRERNRNKSNG